VTVTGILDRWFSWRALRKTPQVVIGMICFGFGIALMARAHLGLGPWSVLHEGVALRSGIGLGTADILLSIPILLAWLPLRQHPGLGTLAAGTLIGAFTNVGTSLIDDAAALGPKLAFLAGGTALIATGSGLYLGADLGPGPRDGIMTGLHQRFGWSIRAVRSTLEITVLTVGWMLGGTVGVGTIAFAVLIGPLVQVSLRVLDREGRVMRRGSRL
jgi:uncharacterized membrane protein YczE